MAMIVGIAADVAPAQIGRGRLLKKMRDDLFGSPEQRAKEEAARRAAVQKKREAARRKAELEAQRRAQANRQPTPAQRNRQPTPIQRTPVQGTPTQRAPSPRASAQGVPAQRSQQTQQRSPARRQTPSKQVASSSNKQSKRVGFGFEIVERKDKLIISKIDGKGNAAEIGLKRGDEIVGIGGIDVDTKESFDEIAGILNSGDTIEISYKRKGQVDDILIPFGQPEEMEDTAGIEDEIQTPSRIDGNDFAPPANTAQGSRRGDRSDVLEREIQQLNRTVSKQRQTIEQLRTQIRALQQTSAPQLPNRPSSRTGSSVLQGGPAFNGPGN